MNNYMLKIRKKSSNGRLIDKKHTMDQDVISFMPYFIKNAQKKDLKLNGSLEEQVYQQELTMKEDHLLLLSKMHLMKLLDMSSIQISHMNSIPIHW